MSERLARVAAFALEAEEVTANYQIGFGGVVAQPAIGPSWKIRGAINSAAA